MAQFAGNDARPFLRQSKRSGTLSAHITHMSRFSFSTRPNFQRAAACAKLPRPQTRENETTNPSFDRALAPLGASVIRSVAGSGRSALCRIVVAKEAPHASQLRAA